MPICRVVNLNNILNNRTEVKSYTQLIPQDKLTPHTNKDKSIVLLLIELKTYKTIKV